WHAAKSTGYGRCLTLAAKGVYDIDDINADTIVPLNEAFTAARDAGGHYNTVLKEKCDIALSIRDAMPDPYTETEDPFVFTLQASQFICPTHYWAIRTAGAKEDMSIHSLSDWMKAARSYIERHLNGKTRVVCLKSALAYNRSLRYDKVPYADADRAFMEFFADRNLADWRAGIKSAKVLEDFMMHHVLSVADDHGLVHQFHTGVHEGNCNYIPDSIPTQVMHLVLEYRNV
ncbi:MAG: hypothetical protein GY851_15270, partial [bacterium]|nr:hypothetical protein [bacterium]